MLCHLTRTSSHGGSHSIGISIPPCLGTPSQHSPSLASPLPLLLPNTIPSSWSILLVVSPLHMLSYTLHKIILIHVHYKHHSKLECWGIKVTIQPVSDEYYMLISLHCFSFTHPFDLTGMSEIKIEGNQSSPCEDMHHFIRHLPSAHSLMHPSALSSGSTGGSLSHAARGLWGPPNAGSRVSLLLSLYHQWGQAALGGLHTQGGGAQGRGEGAGVV